MMQQHQGREAQKHALLRGEYVRAAPSCWPMRRRRLSLSSASISLPFTQNSRSPAAPMHAISQASRPSATTVPVGTAHVQRAQHSSVKLAPY